MKKVRGFTLIELLIVVAIIAILAAIAVPNFLEAQVRSKVSRVKTDQRSLSIALEAYYVDNNIYPAWGRGNGTPIAGCQTYNYAIGFMTNPGTAGNGGGQLPCFLMNNPQGVGKFFTITTPLSYITSYPQDCFATRKGETFSYYAVFPGGYDVGGRGGVGWILWSYGPDVDEFKGSTPSDSPYAAYNPTRSQPSMFEPGAPTGIGPIIGGLVAGESNDSGDNGQDQFTYDPTNGTVSGGDVYRVKQ